MENILKLTADEEAFNLYLNSIINLYDPHSSYFLPVERREFQEGMSGIYYGIGALLQEQNGKVSIAELMIGGACMEIRTSGKRRCARESAAGRKHGKNRSVPDWP